MTKLAVAICALPLVLACTKSHEGGQCDDHSDCRGKLVCVADRCQVDPALHQDMARQSGVRVTGEQARAASSEGAVRIRMAEGREFAFAVCGDDERLIGGWCSPLTDGSGDSTTAVHQRIDGHTETDTIGAQWKCSLDDTSVTAFALCQKLPTAPAIQSAEPAP